MFEPVLNFLDAIWAILFNTLLHLGLHVKNVSIIRCGQFSLNGLHLGEEDSVLVKRVRLKIVPNLTGSLSDLICLRAENNHSLVSLD